MFIIQVVQGELLYNKKSTEGLKVNGKIQITIRNEDLKSLQLGSKFPTTFRFLVTKRA